MKKTIKYGGLVAGVATVAAAMGSTSVFATGIAPTYSGVDAACEGINYTGNYDELTDAEKVEALKADVAAWTKVKACAEDKVAELSADVAAKAAAAGIKALESDGKTMNYLGIFVEASQIEQEFSKKYNFDAETDDLDDAKLLSIIEATEAWTEAFKELNIQNPAAEQKLAFAKANAAKYGFDTIFSDFEQMKKIEALVEAMVAYDDAATALEELPADLKIKALNDEIDTLVKSAKDLADSTAEDFDDAVKEAEKAIAAAEKAGADSADIKKLNDILEAAKEGRTFYDIADVVTKASKAAQDATEKAEKAEEALKEAKNNYTVDNRVDEDSTNDFAKETAEEDLKYWKETYDVEDASEETFKTLVTSVVYDKAVENLKKAGAAEEDIDAKAVAEEISGANSDGYDFLKSGVSSIASDYLDTLQDQALLDAIADYESAKADEEKTDAIANATAGAASEIGKVADAQKAAKAAAEAYGDVAEAAGVTTPSDDDNKGEDNKGETKTYTYETLSDSETAYVAGNALVLHFDAPFEDFDYLTIDGVTIDTSMYTVEEGSTKITLSSALLDTLKSGEHTVIAYYADGKTATAKFTIASAEVATPNTGAYAAEAASATSSVSAVVSAIMAATLAGAAVVLRKRSA